MKSDSKRPASRKAQDRTARKPYSTPRLIVHGTIETITRSIAVGFSDAGTKRVCLFDQGSEMPQSRARACA